ncbi:class I adenylate-forming enzyme family protein [Myceligenerans cantabricum]
MDPGHTFVDGLLTSVADGTIDPRGVALRWFGDRFPGARGAGRGSRVREEVTFAALAKRVEHTAAGLRAAGLRPGDRVLFSIRPRPEGVVLCLAVIHAGGSIVFVDPGSTPELFGARLAAAAPRWAATEALLYAASSGPLARVARSRGLLLPNYGRLPVRHLYAGRWLPGVPPAARRISALAGGREAGVVERAGSPGGGLGGDSASTGAASVKEGPAGGRRGGRDGAEALVVFTSGTTADPKAVVHTTASLAGMLRLFSQVGDLQARQLAHTDQLFLGLPALLAGAVWEIPARTPAADPAAFRRGIAGADSSFAVPADVTALLDEIEKDQRRPGSSGGPDGSEGSEGSARRGSGTDPGAGPRVMAVGAAPVTPALMERATRVLPGTRWICVYGATEMLPAAMVDGDVKVAAGRVVPAVDADADADARPAGDLVGFPLDGVTARIDAPDDDGVGELVLSGPSLMAGYLSDLDAGRPSATEHRTGDLARADADGRLVLVGRTRDMIIRGTVNIYPGLFEPLIRALPGVGEALMVGIPRDDGDERLALVLVADRDSGDAARTGEGHRSPSSGTVELAESTTLVRATEPRLAGVVDHGALPDLVVEASHVPLAGRSRKPDRGALAAAAAPLLRKTTRGGRAGAGAGS